MTDRPILYSFRRCPYAMRARMAIAVSGVQVELREVILRDKPAEMLEASPKATVPVILSGDGRIIEESLEIMYWALGQNDPEGWLERDDDALIAANDGPFKQALDRYKYPHRHGLESGAVHRDEAMAQLMLLNKRLALAPFLSGTKRGLTDIALFPFIRQFAATDQDWFDGQPVPALQKWLNALIASDLFANIMHRYPQWHASDVPLVFPS